MSPTLEASFDELTQLTDDIATRYLDLPSDSRRRVEHRVTKLAPAHIRFVRRTLREALAEGRLSAVEYSHLGDFFERWWAHDAPQKLAVLQRVASLARRQKPDSDVPVGFPFGLSELDPASAGVRAAGHRVDRLPLASLR